jgi:hypothetical protein
MKRTVIPVVLAAYAGCVNGDAPSTSGDMPAGTPIAVDTTAILSVGTTSGDTLHELYRVVTPFLDSRGRLFVPLASSNTIRVFDSDGEFVTSLGRQGAGPGEFEHIGGAWARGDTIEVFDGSLNRITRFHPNDEFEVVSPDGSVGVQGAVAGPVPGGWILHLVKAGGPESTAASASRRDSLILHQFALDGSHLGEIARTRGMTRYQSPVITGPEALSPRARLGVHDGRIYVGETLTPVVRVLEPDGTPVSEIVWETPSGESPADAFAAVVDSAIARSPEDRRASVRTRYAAAPLPDRISAWWDFIVDSEGFLWVKPYEPLLHASALGGFGSGSYLAGGIGHGGTWSIVGPEGGIVNDIELPLAFSPVEVLEDRIVGIRRDSLGVESVAVLRLTRH